MGSERLFGWERLEQDAIDEARLNVARLKEVVEGDSPIEKLFLGALSLCADFGHRVHTGVCCFYRGSGSLERAFENETHFGTPFFTLYVDRQVQIEGWRVDFLIHVAEITADHQTKFRKLIVECDGHDFHERTKKQAERDRSRDRQAQLSGIEVFRFTGAELWRDPIKYADQVLEWAERGYSS
jgi:very-short-patch-repair endonuclease